MIISIHNDKHEDENREDDFKKYPELDLHENSQFSNANSATNDNNIRRMFENIRNEFHQPLIPKENDTNKILILYGTISTEEL